MNGPWFYASATALWVGLTISVLVDIRYGIGVMISGLIIGAGNVLLNRRHARHALDARIDTRVAALAPARAEIEVSPRWWDAKYQELVRKQIPRDPASHDGHDIDEPVLAWSGDVLAAEWCSTCHVPIERPPDG